MGERTTENRAAMASLRMRITDFLRHELGDATAEATRVRRADGHAGFAYLVDVLSRGTTRGCFLRLPPPGVKWQGTADVLRQVCAINALDGSGAPHASVLWSGDDPRWFGAPYFFTELVPGHTLGTQDDVDRLAPPAIRGVARRAMEALVIVHDIDWRARCEYLGPPVELEDDIARWDRFAERAAEPELLALQPEVRSRLLATRPPTAEVGLCHGDFQFGNLMVDDAGVLHAVIDWELCSVGAVLSDVGWVTAFHDAAAWGPALRPTAAHVDAASLRDAYTAGGGTSCEDLPWFQALALYKYAVISGFNLMLHRRGKRPDPAWEQRSLGAPFNLQRALELLVGE